MHPRFTEFAKAFLRYQQQINPTKGIARQLTAMRILERALREDMGVPDITKIDQRHFDRAVAIVGEHKRPGVLTGQLVGMLRKLADLFIVTGAARYWSNPYTGTAGDEYAYGAYAPSSVKAAKVADQGGILSIAQVFGRGYHEKLEDVDVMTTSLTALLLSAPMRISEPIRFRVDCLSQDMDRDGKVQYFLKYWVPKTREFARKPVPATMVETTIEAVRRLTEITEEGRRLAKYMEGSPRTFYRHKSCPNVPDDQVLTPAEVASALGFVHRKSVQDFIHKHTGFYRLTGFTLNSLWLLVLKEHRELNPNFPYQELFTTTACPPPKMSEALICARRQQFALRKGTSPVLLTPFNSSFYSSRLSGAINKRRKNSRSMCFFTRHGFPPLKFKSHGVRHLLNQLARQRGVSIEVITAWSNRSSPRQTLTYLNDDPKQIASLAAKDLSLAVEQTPKQPITSDEAELYGQGPFHRSRYGLCRRSWRAGPCNKFADCLNCSELLMCKGDKVALSSLIRDKSNLVGTYTAAREAIMRGERAASRWVEKATSQIERLNELLSIMSDKSVPEGSPIEVRGTDFTHEGTIVEDKAREFGVKLLTRENLALEYGAELLACLDELRGASSA